MHLVIIVLIDYATSYPEAVPPYQLIAEKIAEKLPKLFTRLGLPKEILALCLKWLERCA